VVPELPSARGVVSLDKFLMEMRRAAAYRSTPLARAVLPGEAVHMINKVLLGATRTAPSRLCERAQRESR
jgi:hypothetical protein